MTLYVIYTISGSKNGNLIIDLFLDGQARWGGYITKKEPVGISIFGIIDMFEEGSIEPFGKIVCCASNSLHTHLPTDFYHYKVSFTLNESLFEDDIWHRFRTIDQIALKALRKKQSFTGFERFASKRAISLLKITDRNIKQCSPEDLIL